jgi:hypothetical protein
VITNPPRPSAPPPLYRASDPLQVSRAKVADDEGVAQASMDGKYQWEMVKPGGRSPDWKDCEVFAEVYVN